jgi:hypothetical protein
MSDCACLTCMLCELLVQNVSLPGPYLLWLTCVTSYASSSFMGTMSPHKCCGRLRICTSEQSRRAQRLTVPPQQQPPLRF